MKLDRPPPIQDVAPPGGFPEVKVARNLPKGGASAVTMAAGTIFLFSWGLYKVSQANKMRREWRREDMDVRLATLPFLMAESDVRGEFLRGRAAEHEAEIMKDVPSWEAGASVYKTRYMAPMTLKGVPTYVGRYW